eukprot:gnl/MRDRNA2_/MRDRNA2_252194_c0_seq1.p1 gnl/MRDRNA2_/MRDRNA2_252194_c0~~gnl/MRDRNA2_/MRDRNA2_252194_c0_seq1.p1  ORF type:complete len:126 (-),score=9.08 gnl/MRDRNA2_/MRDRNA2_252194_c0_seq1:176-553(-)
MAKTTRTLKHLIRSHRSAEFVSLDRSVPITQRKILPSIFQFHYRKNSFEKYPFEVLLLNEALGLSYLLKNQSPTDFLATSRSIDARIARVLYPQASAAKSLCFVGVLKPLTTESLRPQITFGPAA